MVLHFGPDFHLSSDQKDLQIKSRNKSCWMVFLFNVDFIVTSSATDKKLEIDKKLENKLEIYNNLEIKLEVYKNLEIKLEIYSFINSKFSSFLSVVDEVNIELS